MEGPQERSGVREEGVGTLYADVTGEEVLGVKRVRV